MAFHRAAIIAVGSEMLTPTREAVAGHLRLAVREDQAIVEKIARRFASRGWQMPEVNRRQAMVPDGAEVLDNPNGTAPGLWLESRGKAIALLPGPPREMRPMFERIVAERLAPRAEGKRVVRRVIKIAGRGESKVEELTQPVYSSWRQGPHPIETTILAMPGQVELHLSARGSELAAIDRALDAAVAQIEAVMGKDIFTVGTKSMEEVVGISLRERGWRIALAESCTGGLATSRLTDVPGASDYVERSIVAYSNTAKVELLGVDPGLIETHGAVSEPVAEAMARGIRDRARVDVGVGITGIAGPGGGSEQKPVGTVCISVVAPEAEPLTRTMRFPGNREHVKAFSAFTALDMVRRATLHRD